MEIRSIYPANSKRSFELHEAKELTPLLLTITRKSKNEVVALKNQLNLFRSNKEKSADIQGKMNEVVQKWTDKMGRLGTIPVGLWKVKIPHQDEFFLWEFPKEELHLISH